MTQERVKWGFWRKWKWRIKAFKYIGVIAMLFPYPEIGFAHPMLDAFYIATAPLIADPEEAEKAPLLKEVYLYASDIIEPYIYGDEKAQKEGNLERVYTEAEKMLIYLKELEQREPYASWLIRKIVSSYLIDVSNAFMLLYEVEKDKKFHRVNEFFTHIAFAIDDLDEKELQEAYTCMKELIKT